MIKTLDGTPTNTIVRGETYLVPCVRGLPVVLPSHIDEGEEGPTGRHWHTDSRFDIMKDASTFDKETRHRFGLVDSYTYKAPVVKDQGEEVVYEERTAATSVLVASGGIFSSLVWLYMNVHGNAKDGHCPHHRTPLYDTGNCLTCPAHGLKFKKNGEPFYRAPYFLRAGGVCVPIQPRKASFKFEKRVRNIHEIELVDSDGEIIASHPWDHGHIISLDEGDTITASFSPAWETSNFCARFTDNP